MSKPKVLVSRAIFPEIITKLEQHFEIESNQADEIWSKAQLAAARSACSPPAANASMPKCWRRAPA